MALEQVLEVVDVLLTFFDGQLVQHTVVDLERPAKVNGFFELVSVELTSLSDEKVVVLQMTELIKLHELLKVPISAYFESYDRRTLQLIVFQAPDKAHVNPEPTVLGGAIYAQEDAVVGRYPFRIFC